jgi:7,8-dihydro-6-hydroxymethylpterin-pyrophosphokinase
VRDQPACYNAACRIETGLEPESLLRFLKPIEHEIGRRPGGPPGGPRPIDLDILLYDDRTHESQDLTIPHPRLAERAFVLVPLAEIAPEVRHPQLGETISALEKAVDASGVRRIKAVGWDGVVGREGRVRL